MRLSKRQILKLIYEQQVQDSSTPAEVKPEEDVWGTGEEALEEPVDHESAAGVEEDNVTEPEVMEIVEKLLLKRRLQRIIREQAAMTADEEMMDAAGEVVADVVEPPAEEERASASQQSLRNWLKDTASMVDGMGIADNQIPALIAAMDDLMSSAQTGKMASREDKVRQHIETE